MVCESSHKLLNIFIISVNIFSNINKQIVYASIFGKFGVKRHGENVFIPYRCYPSVGDVKHLDVFIICKGILDIRRTDKPHGKVFYTAYITNRRKAAELSAIGIAAHAHGQAAEAGLLAARDLFCQKYEPCAGGKHGHAAFNALFQYIKHIQLAKELALGGTLAADQNKPCEVLRNIALFADKDGLAAEGAQHFFMLFKRPLQR